MTKKELITYYAGMALQGLMANPERYRYIGGEVRAGELTQEEATRKNTNKARLLAEGLADELEAAGHLDHLEGGD